MTINFERVFRLVPEKFREQAWIAGGAAFRPKQCGDVDIWILISDETNLISTHHEISEAMIELDIAQEWWSGGIADESVSEKVLWCGKLHNGTVSKRTCSRDIDLMIAQFPTITSLLVHFDIEAHARAFDWHGERIVLGPEYPQALRVQKYTTPDRTLDRLARLTERYQLPVAGNDKQKLQAIIQKQKDDEQAEIDADKVRSRFGILDEVPF